MSRHRFPTFRRRSPRFPDDRASFFFETLKEWRGKKNKSGNPNYIIYIFFPVSFVVQLKGVSGEADCAWGRVVLGTPYRLRLCVGVKLTARDHVEEREE